MQHADQAREFTNMRETLEKIENSGRTYETMEAVDDLRPGALLMLRWAAAAIALAYGLAPP